MASGLSITLESKRARQLLADAARRVAPRTMARVIGQDFLNWIARNFQAEGLESKWEKLKPITLRRRRKAGVGGRILQDTGGLRQSYVANAPKNIFEIKELEVTVGTEAEQAIYHESSAPRKHLPQRKMLPSDRLAEKLALGTVEAILAEATKDLK